ncbi:MAG: hypothetical protein QME71_07640 [Dehalococcoidia bacterium]|nr:hypothetical protein [Dehalococcoidia bacterium]
MTAIEITVTLIVGFGAALLGSLAVWLFTVWKTVVDGQAAARVIRYELLLNTAKVDLALAGKTGDLNLSDEGWRSHRLAVALLVPESEWFELCRDVGFMAQAQLWIDTLVNGKAQGIARQHLEIWQSDLHDRRKVLSDIEYSGRLPLMLRLLKRNREGEEKRLLAKLAPSDTSEEPPTTQEAVDSKAT